MALTNHGNDNNINNKTLILRSTFYDNPSQLTPHPPVINDLGLL